MPAQDGNKCPRCGAALVWKQDDKPPDRDWRRKLALDHNDMDDQVIAWRLHQLLAIQDSEGNTMDIVEAEHLSARTDVDVHLLRRLARDGCPIATAVEICA